MSKQLRLLVTGPNGYLRELQHMNTWGVAFAALQASAPGARGVTPQQYHHWLDKVSQCEFADELILAATAEYLKLCIVVVPYTPSSAAQPWAISEHPCREARETQGMDETRLVVLGNNDVHYVWLHKS